MATSVPSTDIAKRPRTNVKQSKYGCFTCKARRIKCDEAKPACGRCLSAKRSCEGYPRGAPTDPSLRTISTPSLSLLSFTLSPTYLPSPFVDLACTVLVRSPRRARNDLEQVFWSRVVPQLAHSIPSVRAAVGAFGASYKEFVLTKNYSSPGLETAKQYTQALSLVQQDLATFQHGPIPCIIACLFLASVEAMQQRLEQAHLHLLGAFSLLKFHTDKKLLADVDIEGVSLLLQKLDLHVATYALPHPPNLPAPSPVTQDILASYPPDEALFKILHSCYHFNAEASPYKYTSHRSIPPEVLIEQGRHLGSMKQWLSRNTLPNLDSLSRIEDESLLVLRSQCLAALIYTANILEPRETAYDCYGPDFREIVRLIEVLSQLKDHDTTSHCQSFTEPPSFIPEMGIIQPLYFTAKKYRNSFWRRKALTLLLKSGKEGPWCGETEGSVVAAVIRTEEGLPGKEPLDLTRLENATTDSPSNIPERNRVNACWTIDPEDEDEEPTWRRYNRAIMFRCLDIEGLLQEEGQEPRQFPWQDSKYWETWIQPLED
ncbi:hypothetical protein G7046_g3048 [Stylonectria norvegica]|nr:hypothetical protein G7046_g3048 [Stylonectria norvegica]